jgi:hypothetical protein
MTEWFLALPLLIAAVAFWLSTMASRDAACSLVARYCEENKLQLLDQTVALRRVSLRRKSNGNLSFVRVFRFDYSDNGFRRRDGMIWMLASRPLQISVQIADREVLETLGAG